MPTAVLTKTGAPIQWKNASGVWVPVQAVYTPAPTTDWAFHASGIAAPADPTTQAFGYTALAGQLLYFVAFGPMTQIVPAGWTEQLNPPIGDCEMSVMRKVAVGGENSITIDHNGSRPMAWAFWAFPVGSTPFGSGSAKLNSVEDGQDLTGLPGTPVTTINVHGRVVGSGITGTTANAAWTGATELFDNLLPATGGLDGTYMTGAVNQDYVGTTTNVDVAVTATNMPNTNRYWCAWAVKP
jgi:hypothetical protein